MVKNILIIVGALLTGCFVSKDGYSQIRRPLSRFSVKPSQSADVYALIDTGALYLRIKINGMDSLEYVPGKYIKVAEKQNSIKFYANGRAAGFQNVDFKSPGSLDPTKARMGMYGIWKKKDGLYEESISHSPQAGVFLIKRKITVKGDTLYLDDGKFDYMYIKKKIPSHLLIYKPDW
jgi:hypothetical protein